MAKRYGRNQKRAARQKIAEMEAALLQMTERSRQAENRAWQADARARTARESALEEYIQNHGLIKNAVETISYELGRSLGPTLKPHAEKLLASDRRRPRAVVDFSASVRQHDSSAAVVLRGEIPALHYNIMLFS